MEVGSISALSLEGRLEAAYAAQSLTSVEKVNVPSETQTQIAPVSEQPVQNDAVYVTLGESDFEINSVYNSLGELASAAEAEPTAAQLRTEDVNEDQVAFIETEQAQDLDLSAEVGSLLSVFA